MVVPPVVPLKGRTTASGVVVGVFRGSQAIGLRIRGFTGKRRSVMRGFRCNSLVLVQKIKPRA